MKPWRGIAGRLLLAPAAWLVLGGAAPLWTAADVDQRLLAAHNAERIRLGIPPLRWSDKLARQSLEWARQLALIDGLEHSDTADYADPTDGEEGENLWRGTKGYYTPEQMVNLWVDERKIFVNAPFPRNSTTGQWRDVGHYTQLVWRSTTEVGCAIASSEADEVLVCRYLEGGNVIGEKPY
ncbi:CAP domain-containing protein [Rhizorhabdus dicambivorans]|uniref:SCP-like extracellular n=1 Tax=Rhizorhabdus dicambivorans TaxID=1850238 RepID=A0A2A4FTX9_9SPHN|nr:CAP domain-containing protein [Rhizorhabdus dicambivorans]ATE65520.1 SCP-like extracellular [Rhizorhabdus dicambivorans]PCE41863.1 SCP-like extracellular [Rhizorhabdus dicambivorans]